MNRKGLLAVSTIILLLTLCPLVSADENKSLGVKAGDYVVYTFGTSWQTNQSSMLIPQELLDAQNKTSVKYEILNVTGQTIRYTVTYFYNDSSSKSLTYTGDPKLLGIAIMPNQTVSDILSIPIDATILHNDTLMRTYGSGETQRIVNRLEYTQSIDNTTEFITSTFWDNQTGLKMESYLNYTVQSEDMTLSWSIYQIISDTNLFQITTTSNEFILPPIAIPIIAGVGVTVPVVAGVAFYLRKRRSKPEPDESALDPPNPFQTPIGHYTPSPYYHQHPYYRKSSGVSPYKQIKQQPRFSSYDASLYQKPHSNYVRPGTTVQLCPNCKQIVSANESYCPHCNKRLW
ncbi:MAG: zinc ribbon domain-containing protein [Candidatus Bathyarchaeota archaeon]|nr:zinc ribbon domain-containing protein [Candidatus Bathyarchaeota archaeon]